MRGAGAADRVADGETPAAGRGTAGEVFLAFLKLGLTAFGGPVAHLGYFRDELVVRRRWIDEAGYADLVALCQFLPGPASSQVGFALGLRRGGFAGGLAAWTAFTLPSAILLAGFAYGAAFLAGPTGLALVHGLKLVAVAIVAHAVWGMARSLAPDLPRGLIAVAAFALVLVAGGVAGQLGAIAVGAVAGLAIGRSPTPPSQVAGGFRVGRTTALACIGAFAALLVALPLAVAATGNQGVAVFDAFYRSGALVFGGGHVVLPLLQAEVVPTGWISDDRFLAGYGAAQAVPGPLFAFAAYLGWSMATVPNGIAGAAIALVAVFLPGLLLVTGALPFWDRLRARPNARAAMRGTNAAVVGILAAALYDPVWTGSVRNLVDAGIALLGLLALLKGARPWQVVAGVTAAAMVVG
ncbi:MAG: chromate transporter [Alphaproteobacteria bacterium]|nr:MAG: chromate transporter [Alphaproteobacteria bacterium]